MGHKLRISAKGLFYNDKGEVLLIKGKLGTYWAVPGGGVDEGENLRQAVERELWEETSYTGKAEDVILLQDYIGQEDRQQLEVFFRGKITGHDDTVIPDHEFAFYDQESIKAIELKPLGLDPFANLSGVEYKER